MQLVDFSLKNYRPSSILARQQWENLYTLDVLDSVSKHLEAEFNGYPIASADLDDRLSDIDKDLVRWFDCSAQEIDVLLKEHAPLSKLNSLRSRETFLWDVENMLTECLSKEGLDVSFREDLGRCVFEFSSQSPNAPLSGLIYADPESNFLQLKNYFNGSSSIEEPKVCVQIKSYSLADSLKIHSLKEYWNPEHGVFKINLTEFPQVFNLLSEALKKDLLEHEFTKTKDNERDPNAKWTNRKDVFIGIDNALQNTGYQRDHFVLSDVYSADSFSVNMYSPSGLTDAVITFYDCSARIEFKSDYINSNLHSTFDVLKTDTEASKLLDDAWRQELLFSRQLLKNQNLPEKEAVLPEPIKELRDPREAFGQIHKGPVYIAKDGVYQHLGNGVYMIYNTCDLLIRNNQLETGKIAKISYEMDGFLVYTNKYRSNGLER